ncbi:YgcG family protein [Pelistega sp. NLN82]|uniref:YgcG family protein n=1 Tax=Pelistega ratti TaxID=2652177 RepID=A0A6L9Y6J8_9BURK|nr:YgcG family protein [Pelistega ratti]NEN75537.1 YgcG family protein [Pelistega ratti]
MKRILRLLLGLLLLVSASSLWAQESAIPALSNYATDTTGTLSASELERLNRQLKALDQETGSQIFILMIPTVQPDTIESYAVRVFEAWKVGRKGIDDGVLFVIAKEDRRNRIEVGYGLEGAIPDVVASRLLRNTVAPYFQQGQFVQGIEAAVAEMIQLIKKENLPQQQTRSDDADGLGLAGLVIIFFIACILAVFIHPIFGAFIAGQVAFGLLESAVIAVVLAAIVLIVASILRTIFKAPLSAVSKQLNSSNARRRHNPWKNGGFGGGFGGDGFGGFGGGGFGGGGGGSSGGGGASGGW